MPEIWRLYEKYYNTYATLQKIYSDCSLCVTQKRHHFENETTEQRI